MVSDAQLGVLPGSGGIPALADASPPWWSSTSQRAAELDPAGTQGFVPAGVASSPGLLRIGAKLLVTLPAPGAGPRGGVRNSSTGFEDS